jgi:hypothetical protein
MNAQPTPFELPVDNLPLVWVSACLIGPVDPFVFHRAIAIVGLPVRRLGTTVAPDSIIKGCE